MTAQTTQTKPPSLPSQNDRSSFSSPAECKCTSRSEITALTNLAWQIAYTALWNTKDFSTTEKALALNSIAQILQQQTSPKKAYNNFVQRVLLARQYIISHPGTYAPIPSVWLCSNNKNGFAGTQKWLAAVEKLRSSIPAYRQELKAFAEAINETATSGSAADFHYWRSYFIQQNSQGLLNLFLSTIANLNNNKH
jgi:hypothetical protein